jgi:phenylalanyl-tRNA synthetase beta chain
MLFSYNWLQSFFKKKLPSPQKLANSLTMHFAEVEEIKKRGRDFVFNIEIKPNRAGDCFSHFGVAREITAVLNLKIKNPGIKLLQDKKTKTKDFATVEVKDKKACPRYTAGVITNFKVGLSPKWLADRLSVCGLRTINNIVDIANYVMLETGQPLHAFDGEKLKGKKLIVRFARKDETIAALDGEKYHLSPDILLIADAEKPLAIAGIKGGKFTEIDKKTKVIVLESANFNSRVIRKGSQKLKLKTDASWRFEHGIDPNLTEFAVKRAAFLIQKIAGGKTAQGLIDVYPKKVLPKRIRLNLDYVKRLLGIDIPESKIEHILDKLGLKVRAKSSRLLEIEVPTSRLDITLPEDLIEEIGRIYGYEKIPTVFPQVSLIPPKRNEELFWENKIKDILRGAGFIETYNYSFLPWGQQDLIELKNPLSKEQKYLRNSLIPNLLKNIQNNKNYLKPGEEIRIFELGTVFWRPRKEKKMLSGIISGENKFYDVKGAVDLLLRGLGISNAWYDDYRATPEDSRLDWWHPKKCAEIKVNHQEIGFLGEIKKEPKAAVFDFDFAILQKLVSEEHEYRLFSRYPSAVRDLAILVPLFTRVEEVLNIIETVAGALVRDVDLFDIYEGEELPEGKKNLAFHIIYQSDEKTLTSDEVEKIQQKIIKALEKNITWQVRK